MITDASARAYASSIIPGILSLPPDQIRAVTDQIVAAVTVELDPAFRQPSPPAPARWEPPPLPEPSPEETAARVLDTERWGPCCYGEACDGDDSRPHIHCWGFHRHVFDREAGREIPSPFTHPSEG